MPKTDIIYGALLFLAMQAALASAVLAWRRRAVQGATAVALFTVAMAWWSGTYAMHWASAAQPTRLFWLDATYVGVVAAPGFFFAFALLYTGRGHWLSPSVRVALCVEPLATLALLFTDSHHGLFYGGTRAADAGSIFSGGPWFWANVIYQYGLLLAAMVMLATAYRRAPRLYRRQAAVVLIGALIPWVLNIVSFAGLNPLPNLDLTPIAFTLSGLVISYGLFRYRFLDIVPVARDTLVECMSDGLMVLDTSHRIVDLNPAALRLIGRDVSALVGRDLAELTAMWPAFPTHFAEHGDTEQEIPVEQPVQGVLSVRSVVLTGHGQVAQGWLVVLRDVTARRQMEQEREELIETLQQAIAQVRTLNGLLPICANCKKIRDDQGYWHQIEVYIHDHSEADFSHGICPDCIKKLYPELMEDNP